MSFDPVLLNKNPRPHNPMKIFTASWKRWIAILVILGVLLAGGYWGGRRVVWPRVKAWRAERMNKEARDFLASGDDANALLTARKILQTSKDNIEAWRIAAAAARRRNTPDVVFYQQNVARLAPTKENYLELIRLSLQYGALRNANDGIEAIAAKAGDDPEFHALAAQFYRRIGKLVAAKFHLIALTQLRPSDRAAQLELAELEMADDPGRKDRALRARVRALADDPSLRVRALTLLLRESINAKLAVETTELVNRLKAVPDLGINERLLLLEGSTLMEGPSLSVLDKLEVEVADKPDEVVRVMDFLARTGQRQKQVAWFATLPEETKKNENVRRQVAEALLSLGDWNALEGHLKSNLWPNEEYVRHAFLAYAYRMQGRTADFNESWNTAVVAVGTDPRTAPPKINTLMGYLETWKWTAERYDLIWKLFTIVPTNTAAQQALAEWERRQGNTSNLNKLFARVVEINPRDVMALNNHTYTSLLLDSNIARAGLMASQLFAAKPEDPFIVTTYAFALYKQGKASEALAKLESLSPSELSAPERMLYHAVFLARVGEADRASELLKGLNLKNFLPEERRLAEIAEADIARNVRTQDDKSRLNTIKQTGETTSGGWLTLVAPETKAAASVEMQLTDPLYAGGDWTALRSALRSADWKEDNYLRFALLSYAVRSSGDLGQSNDLWKQALTAAGRTAGRAENLQRLATEWKWSAESIDVQNLIFERSPTDRALLAELVKHYRETRRTRELLRVITLYVSRTSDTSDEAVSQAYYSLISDANVPRAHVLAKTAFESSPDDPTRRIVYAFSLWKQHRAAEANALLADLKLGSSSGVVPVALLRSAIDVDLGLFDEAQSNLALFITSAGLPEEVALAEKISGQIAKHKAAPASAK